MNQLSKKDQLTILRKREQLLLSLNFPPRVNSKKGVLDLDTTGTAASTLTLIWGNKLRYNPLMVGISSLLSYKAGELLGKYNKTQIGNNAAELEKERQKELKKVQSAIEFLVAEINEENDSNLIENESLIIEKQNTKIIKGKGYKMMQGKDLRALENRRYELDGDWKNLYGYFPLEKLWILVYGRRKNGKTHHAIQLAQYLEEKYGGMLYFSAEEGTEDPFKDKLERWKGTFKVLYDVAGCKGIEEGIKDFKPNFVVIDSKDRLKIKIEEIEYLKDKYPKIGFILISQVTADGKPRGTESIEHEVSSLVHVVKGVAIQEGRMVEGETKMAVFEDVVLEEVCHFP